MGNELVVHSMDDVKMAAGAMAKSGYFTDAKEGAQAMVKVMAGHEMGFGPFASMTGIHVIQGKPAIGSNLIAAAIKKHPLYNFRVMEHTDKSCSINFFERWDGKWENIGESVFTIQDAQTAGLLNNPTWKKYPKNMLFSRAISNGARWYCPDVFGGAPTYTPDELGADVDEDGYIDIQAEPEPESVDEIIDAVIEPEPIEESPVPYPSWVCDVENRSGERYIDIDSAKLSHMMNALEKAESTPEREAKKKAIKVIFETREQSVQPAQPALV